MDKVADIVGTRYPLAQPLPPRPQLDTLLIPRRDSFHAVLLIDTVAPDFRADASALVDLRQAPMVYEVADQLDEIKSVILQGDWDAAAQLYRSYEKLVERYGPELR